MLHSYSRATFIVFEVEASNAFQSIVEPRNCETHLHDKGFEFVLIFDNCVRGPYLAHSERKKYQGIDKIMLLRHLQFSMVSMFRHVEFAFEIIKRNSKNHNKRI